jgi:hypothetical protein
VWEPQNIDKKIVTVTVALLVCVSALSLVTPVISKKPDKTTRELPSNDAVNELGIETYWDSKCTRRVSSIDWGSLEPGTSKTVALFIKNKGKTPVTLSHYVANCEPFEIANWLTLVWDYTGQSIEFKEAVQVVFDLYVSENAEPMETFSFDIIIVDNQ